MFTSLNTRVYNLTPRTELLPAFLNKQERKYVKLSESEQYQLLQSAYFPHYASSISISPDGKYMLASGSYPHQVRMFDLQNQTVKFQRNQTAETVSTTFLGSDWKKFALVLDDKTVEIHNQQGRYFGARLPTAPRCCCFDCHEANLLVGGSGCDIHRLDLYRGQFNKSFMVQQRFINGLLYDRNLELAFTAGDKGVYAIDFRLNKPAGQVTTSREATGCAVLKNNVYIGLADGSLLIYDVRSAVPTQKISTGRNQPIQQLDVLDYGGEKFLAVADPRQLRVYEGLDAAAARLKLYIEPGTGIHRFSRFDQSGLLAMACEDEFINFFYVPDLGPAPAWAKDLDQQIEVMDVQQQSGQFLNYKFCTRQEIEALGLLPLVSDENSGVVAYMHGFYVPKDLYKKGTSAAGDGDDFRQMKDRKRRQLAEEKAAGKKRKAPAKHDDRFDFE